MGNASAIPTVNKIITLGGIRECNGIENKPYIVKPTSKTSKTPNNKSKKSKTGRKKDPLIDKKSTSKLNARSISPNSTPSIGESKQKGTDQLVDNGETVQNKHLVESTSQNKFEKKDDEKIAKKSKRIASNAVVLDSSSEVTSSCSTSVTSDLQISSKNLNKQKFRAEWQREEKRMLLEYNKAEEKIRNSQRDELRAKVEIETWRDKLEQLTAEHRKHLFKQAQTLHSRLYSAEKMLTYHEVRAKKLQMKNDQMKDLICSVKEEAQNLRFESEKRREVTQKIFDEKFSTVEKQLTKLKHKLGQTKDEDSTNFSCKCHRTKPFFSWRSQLDDDLLQNTPVNPYSGKPNYSRYFKTVRDQHDLPPGLFNFGYTPLSSDYSISKTPFSSRISPGIFLPTSSQISDSTKWESDLKNYSLCSLQLKKAPLHPCSICICKLRLPSSQAPSNSFYSTADAINSEQGGKKEITNQALKNSNYTMKSTSSRRSTKKNKSDDVNENFNSNYSEKKSPINDEVIPTTNHCLETSRKNSNLQQESCKSGRSSGSSILMRLFNMSRSDTETSSTVMGNPVKFINERKTVSSKLNA